MNLKPSKKRGLVYSVVAIGLFAGGYVASVMGQNPPTAPKGPQAGAPQGAGGPSSGAPGKGPPGAGQPVAVEMAPVLAVRLEDALSAVGSLRSAESVVLKSEVAGRIARIGFVDGARVTKGQALIEFDSAVQRAQADQAQAEHELAVAKLRRTQELFEKKFLSAAALDDAKAGERVASAKLALARATLEKYTLRAPFDGVAGIRQVSVGDYVKDGVELFSLEDTREMKADFRLPEQVVGRVRVGQSLSIEADAQPGQSFPARVTALDSAVDASGRSLLVRAVLSSPSPQLKPGMFVRVRLVLEAKNNALVIPEEAVVAAQGTQFVFRVLEGKAVRTPIVTGVRTQHDQKAVVEVRKGLAAGEMVITAGQIKIRGDQVPVRPAGPR